jgi:hypothetical protein
MEEIKTLKDYNGFINQHLGGFGRGLAGILPLNPRKYLLSFIIFLTTAKI